MKNYVTSKKKMSLCSLLIGALLLTLGCQNTFDPPEVYKPAARTGYFSLAVNGLNAGRTIAPATVQDDFEAYTLVFFTAGTTSNPLVTEIVNKDHLSDPVALNAGTYDLYVIAYMDEELDKPAAQGSLKGIVINANNLTSAGVSLLPIVGTGEGTFSYDIGYPEDGSVISASMTIIPLPVDESGPSWQTEYDFVGGTPPDSKAGISIMDTGYYRVIFKLSNDKEKTIERWETLHIYQNMESVFEYVFTADEFSFYLPGEVVVDSYNAGDPCAVLNNLSSSIDYDIVNLTGEYRTNVMKVINPAPPAAYEAALYDLTDYKDEWITIEFSADVKRVGAAGDLIWNVNNDDYPVVGDSIKNAAADEWHSMSGTWMGNPSNEYPKFYLSTYENNSDSTTYYIADFKITVTVPDEPAVPSSPVTFKNITAAQLVADIKVGWNLGNSLDASDKGEGWLKGKTVAEMEEGWDNPVTTNANIDAIKTAGFNAIRIPVSWDKAVYGDYKIRKDWMARVTEVVNYAVDNDMYIILNTHHDEHTFKFTDDKIDASLAAFKKIWEQIADNFKNYDEKLIFEGLNEPRTEGGSAEWSGGTPAEHANLNRYYPIFVNAVRTSGGNNDKRILMITPYAASPTTTAVNALTLPTDTATGKLVVSTHAYVPYAFALDEDSPVDTWSKSTPSDTKAIQDAIQPAYDKFISDGIPVIMGEFGAVDKNNEAARALWAEYYVSYAKSKGVACFYWDDNGTFKLLDRNSNAFEYPAIVTALVDATTIPKPITGNLGNYTFGEDGDGSNNYTQARWTLTGANLNEAKMADAQLVLRLSDEPTNGLHLVWQGPANDLYWNSVQILGDGGEIEDSVSTNVVWNSSDKTLTINLAVLADYSIFIAQPSLNLIVAYYGGDNINDLGIVKADIIVPFSITFDQLADAAPDITVPTISRSNPPDGGLTLDNPGQYDYGRVEWHWPYGMVLGYLPYSLLADLAPGKYYLTVEVTKNGVPYNKTVIVTVTY